MVLGLHEIVALAEQADVVDRRPAAQGDFEVVVELELVRRAAKPSVAPTWTSSSKLSEIERRRRVDHGRGPPPGGDRPALREATALRTRLDARTPPRRSIPTMPSSMLHERTRGIGL